jgi:hypothetical protein
MACYGDSFTFYCASKDISLFQFQAERTTDLLLALIRRLEYILALSGAVVGLMIPSILSLDLVMGK